MHFIRGHIKLFPVLFLAALLVAPTMVSASFDKSLRSGPVGLAASLGDRVSLNYTGRQMQSGRFPDYVRRFASKEYRNQYGPGIMGGALVLSGVRSGRDNLVQSGLRSIRLAIETREGLERVNGRGERYKSFEYPFSLLGILEGWQALHAAEGRVIKRSLSRNSRQTVELMKKEIAKLTPIPEEADNSRWSEGQNRVFLERLIWLQAISTGIKAVAQKSHFILARPQLRRSQAERFLKSWLETRPIDLSKEPLLFASDSPMWPLSYHALSSSLIAKTIPLTSGSLRTSLEEALGSAVRATRFLISPDGDLAYSGRSTMQSWTLSLAAYSALATARISSLSSSEVSLNRELAYLMINRLSQSYVRSDNRLMITPSLNPSPQDGVLVLDRYAAEVSYAGLTLLGLGWASGELDGERSPLTETGGYAWAENNTAAFAISRTQNLWTALRTASPDPEDRRLDFGPAAAKQFFQGQWEWLIPPRPLGEGRGPNSWLRLHHNGKTLIPESASISRAEDGWIHQILFKNRNSGLQNELVLFYSAADCGGIEIRLDNLNVSAEIAFWLPAKSITTNTTSVSGSGIQLRVSRPVNIRMLQNTPGPAHSRLSPLIISSDPNSEGTSITLCRTG